LHVIRFIAHLVWVAGSVLLVVGFGRYSAASLPYQDATPELLARQQAQVASAKTVLALGALVFGGGVVWVRVRRRPSFHGVAR
jgi:hypothetical protein